MVLVHRVVNYQQPLETLTKTQRLTRTTVASISSEWTTTLILLLQLEYSYYERQMRARNSFESFIILWTILCCCRLSPSPVALAGKGCAKVLC